MLFKEYMKSYVEFCDEEIMREIILAKRKYLREERRAKNQCVLNATDENDDEYINSLMDNTDITEDNDIDFIEKIENEKLAKCVKLLSDREQKVVSLRIDKGMSIKEINIVIGTQREATSSRIYGKALKRIKKYYEED